jgi:hypothetical protein
LLVNQPSETIEHHRRVFPGRKAADHAERDEQDLRHPHARPIACSRGQRGIPATNTPIAASGTGFRLALCESCNAAAAALSGDVSFVLPTVGGSLAALFAPIYVETESAR